MGLKERPILYKADMIRAIQRGIKSQTRRVVPLQPKAKTVWCGADGMWRWGKPSQFPSIDDFEIGQYCKFGVPGDRLWVRENFAIPGPGFMSRDHDGSPIFQADYPIEVPTGFGPWKPSIFMPRSICRIALEITEVRVQRIQDISDDDIIAEGIEEYGRSKGKRYSPRALWIDLWDSINAKRDDSLYAWDRNPWTWAISFRRIAASSLAPLASVRQLNH